MPRNSVSVDLSSPTARRRLQPLPKSAVYWLTLAEGQHLGYRKPAAGGGTWWARLYLGEGRYTPPHGLGSADDLAAADGRSVLSYRQALEVATDWWRAERRRQESLAAGDETGVYFVSDAARDYLSWFREHREAYEQTLSQVTARILPALGSYQLAGPPVGEALSRKHVRRWLEGLASSPARLRSTPGRPANTRLAETDEERRRRRSTANRVLTTLKAMLNFAVAEGAVPRAMADAWQIGSYRQADAPKVRHLERDEAVRLLQCLDQEPDLAALIEGALHTGCRYGELRRMNAGDYLPHARVVVIHKSKGGKPRHVHLSDEGVAFFDSRTAGKSATAPIFTKLGRRWEKSEPNRPLKAACRQAEIDPPIGINILRHTYATLYLMQGGDLPALSEQLGHASIALTKKHYGHLADRWRAADARKHAPKLGRVQAGAEVAGAPVASAVG